MKDYLKQKKEQVQMLSQKKLKKFPVSVVVLYITIKEVEVMNLRENNGKGGKGKGNMI